ncbi:MAG: PD40 domain-containing protein [Bacteroidia bacterium]|nr:PD40 domain-containing protein [Bacteroidia bacterium]
MLNRTGKPALLPMLMLFLSISTGIFAQAGYKSEEELIKSAEKFFSEKNYERAFPLYSQIVSNRPDNSYYNYCLGVCIMKAGTDKAEAIRFLDIATKSPQNPSDSWLYLGNAYHQSYRYEEAIAAYENFKLNGGRSSWNNAKGDLLIKMCRNGIMVKNDLSMNRHRILEKAEIEGADFYTLYKNLNDWGRFLKLPKEYEDKNTKERPESAYLFLATKGNVMMYANTGKSSDRGFDVFKVIKDQKGLWTFPEALAEIINTSGDEAFPVIINEGKTIFFSSRGERSTGGYDVFRSDLNESTGTWSEPVSLGPPVNSPADDYYYLPSADNSIAYFASNRESTGTKCHVYKASIIREDRNFVAISGLFNCVAGLDLSDAKVTILDPENRAIVAEFRTPSQQGDYHLKLPSGTKYIYQVELVGFNSQEQLVDLAAYTSPELIQEIMLVRTDQGKEVMNITNRVPVKSDVVAQNNEQKLLQVGAAPGGVESRMATRNNSPVNAVAKEDEEMVLASAQPVSDKTTSGSKSNDNSNNQTTKNNPATAENESNRSALTNSGSEGENSKSGSTNTEPTPASDQKSATNKNQTNNNTQPSSSDDVNKNGVALKSDEDNNNNVVTPKTENVSENNSIAHNEAAAEKNTAAGTKTNESSSQVKNSQTDAVKNTESPNSAVGNEAKNANAKGDLNANEGTAQAKSGSSDASQSSEKSKSQNASQPETKQDSNGNTSNTGTEPLVAVVSNKDLKNNNAGNAVQPASETQKTESKPASSDVAANATSSNKNSANSTSENGSTDVLFSNVAPAKAAEKANSSPASTKSAVPASENESGNKSNDGTGTDAMAQKQVATPSGDTNNQAADGSDSKNNATNSSQNTKAVSSQNENSRSKQSKSVEPSEQAVSVNSNPSTSSDQVAPSAGESTETNKSKDTQTASVDNSGSNSAKSSENSNAKNVASSNTLKGENTNGNTQGDEATVSSAQKTNQGSEPNSSTVATEGDKASTNQVAAPNANSKSTESPSANIAAAANKNGSVNSGTENTDVKKNSSNDVNSNSNVEQSAKENSATSYVLPADPATNQSGTSSTESNSGSPVAKNQASTPGESESQTANNNAPVAENKSNVNNNASETGSSENTKAEQKNKKKGNGLFGRKKQEDQVVEHPVAEVVIPDADSLTKAEAALYKNLVFRVQLGAYKDRSVEDLKKKFEAMGLKDLVYVKNDVGLLLVMTGSESSYEAALALKADMIGKGVADAFIVVYSEGARLPVQMVVQPAE